MSVRFEFLFNSRVKGPFFKFGREVWSNQFGRGVSMEFSMAWILFTFEITKLGVYSDIESESDTLNPDTQSSGGSDA